MDSESRSTVFGHRRNWLRPECGESGRPATGRSPISENDIGTENGKITMSGSGYVEMSVNIRESKFLVS